MRKPWAVERSTPDRDHGKTSKIKISRKTRGDHAICWIEKFCTTPDGPNKGRPAQLTDNERLTIRRIYDAPGGPYELPVTGELAAYLTLLHLCGPEALQRQFGVPVTNVDAWSLWRATTPPLQDVLKRDGERIRLPGS
jgi:hypothetical protein